MATNELKIKVSAQGAEKSEKQIKGVGGALRGMAKQAGIAAAAYFGSKMLLDGIKQSIDLFGQQEMAEKKLRFAAGESTKELIKQAQALQQTTIHGDEAIIAQQAYVKSLGISTEQTKEIIQASVDLSAALGISLESAVMNVTKTLSGMQGELGEKLPASFKDLTAEQLKAGEGIDFIREQFKGFAEQEADTTLGSLDQLQNAWGDLREELGEKLAPTLKNIVTGFKDMITESPVVKTKEETAEFKKLTNALIDVNTSTSTRESIIKTLQQEYPSYLDNIDIEKADTKDLVDWQNKSVQAMMNRINAMVAEQEITELITQRRKLLLELADEELNKQEDRFLGMGTFGQMFVRGNDAEIESIKSKIAFIDEEILKRQTLGTIKLDSDTGELISGEQIILQDMDKIDLMGQLTEATTDQTKEQKKFNKEKEKELQDHIAKVQKDKERNELLKEWIKDNRKAAETLGLVKSAEEKRAEAYVKTRNIMSGLSDIMRGEALAEKRISQINAVINTAEAVTQFLAKGQWVRAAGAALWGGAQVDKIERQKFALGGDFVTDGPQTILVGDNPSGKERVQITPLGGDPNVNGPQGGNITLNIQGSVIGTEQFTEEVLMPQIEEGLRLGNEIGL